MTAHSLEEDVKEEEDIVSNLAEPLTEVRPPSNVHLVRQPLFNAEMEVYAYELLYGEIEKPSDSENGEASQVMLNAFLDLGLETISEDCFSVIRITEDFMQGRLPLPFPPAGVILALPDSIARSGASPVPLEALTSKGYKLSLDLKHSAMLQLEGILTQVHMLRVDLSDWSSEQLESHIPTLAGQKAKLLAANVNSRAQFAQCKELGFDIFQGQFVCEPAMVSGSTLKPNRMALLNILKLLEDPDCNISDLEDLISRDITLSYKILRIINSAFYGFRRKIDSVKQAVVSLGLKVIRDWFIVISLTDIDDKPQSLMFQTLQRARMMQLLCDLIGLNKDTGFTIGLFSSIDAIMDQPMEIILKALPLSEEVTEALLEREGLLGELLDMVIRYEKGDWKNISSVGFEPSELSTYYFESMLWTRGLFEQIRTE